MNDYELWMCLHNDWPANVLWKTRELELVIACQICSEVLFIDSSPGRFDALIHRGFWIISKITIGNLCKLFHGIISLLLSTSN